MRLLHLLAALTITLAPALGCDSSSGAAADAAIDTTAGADADGGAAVDAGGDTLAVDTLVADTSATEPPDFTGPGPYAVGYLSETITYEPADGAGERSLRLAFWYPTHETSGPAPEYAGLISAEGVVKGAAPALTEGPFPVIVFSHGNTSFAEQSYFFTEFMASHGYVVVAPDHTGNTFQNLNDPMPPEIFYLRPWDISAVIDHAEALPSEHLLAGMIGDHIGVSGHSFGGYTSLALAGATWAVDGLLALCAGDTDIPQAACDAVAEDQAIYRAGFRDPRVEAIAPMSPGGTMLFTGGVDAIAAPTLLFTGSMDHTTPNATEGDPTWAQLEGAGGHLRVDFATAGHFTFSNACELPFNIGEDDGCGEGFIDSAEAHRAIDAFALAFFNLHLLGDDAGASILDGSTPLSDDLTLSIGQP